MLASRTLMSLGGTSGFSHDFKSCLAAVLNTVVFKWSNKKFISDAFSIHFSVVPNAQN